MRADYIIIGAGSSGSAVAYRLARAGCSVIVIEYGGTDAGPFIQMPGALSYPMNMSRYDWGYQTEPEPYLNDRRLATPRGKVLGGSSSINGMIYVRGHAYDFDTWQEMGADGWSYADVLPYFKRLERWDDGGLGGDEDWRGSSGPMHVTRGPRENPLHDVFVNAAIQAGYDFTPDYNGHHQEGFGPYDMTVHKGQRYSTAKAYLRPALATGNAKIKRGLACRILFEERQAVGVEVKGRSGHEIIHANKEVILAASAINSPKILMLSGIGPSNHLKAHGITPIADRAGVGQNLQDHLELYIQVACKKPVTLAKYWNLLGKAYVGARWLLSKTGPGASNQFESAGFIRSDAGVPYPDIQFHFLPIAVRYDGKRALSGHGFQAHVGPMRSPSRGSITLRNTDPSTDPRILFNYMSHEKDWQDFRKAIRLTREIFQQPAFAPYYDYEIQPGKTVQEDEELDEFIRQHVESAYHPCGTCRMGDPNDPLAVVDPEGCVIGVDGLRVVDSSVIPQVTNGNLNAPTIMIGEKMADHILGQQMPRDNAIPWGHPHWETQQR